MVAAYEKRRGKNPNVRLIVVRMISWPLGLALPSLVTMVIENEAFNFSQTLTGWLVTKLTFGELLLLIGLKRDGKTLRSIGTKNEIRELFLSGK